jgi:hypothetical protein
VDADLRRGARGEAVESAFLARVVHRVQIGDLAEIEIEDFVPPQSPEGEAYKLTDIYYPPNSTLTIARATTSRFNAFGLEFSHEGKNGLSAPFSWVA